MGWFQFRSSGLLLASLVALGIFAFGAAALGPTLPTLLAERSLATGVEALTGDSGLVYMTDTEIRSRIQQKARSLGFHIEFDDVFVKYLETSQTPGMPLPTKLGYTLRLELPLFGFVDWPLVALRIYNVGDQRTDER